MPRTGISALGVCQFVLCLSIFFDWGPQRQFGSCEPHGQVRTHESQSEHPAIRRKEDEIESLQRNRARRHFMVGSFSRKLWNSLAFFDVVVLIHNHSLDFVPSLLPAIPFFFAACFVVFYVTNGDMD